MALAAQNIERDPERELDMDSLHALPLSIIPLETPALARARLIKNSFLDSAVEIYKDTETGSGQVEPSQLAKIFKWEGAQGYEDQRIIDALAMLHSYDVYTLRIELRRLGIEVNDYDELRLSEAKQEELTSYMRKFTSPLLRHVYGSTEVDVESFDHLVEMFAQPDKELAIRNLKQLAEKLDIDVFAVPAFLEEYGDIFLSLAYYRQCLDEVVPKITSFLETTNELKNNYQLSKDPILMNACQAINDSLNDVTASLTGRFESFDKQSQSMWDNLSAESFRQVRNLISSHHTTVGGALCGLTVKMSLWDEQVRGRKGGLLERADFITSHMRNGIDRIKEIEDSAPANAEL